MKKVLAMILALVMVFALAACGQATAPAATEAPAEAPAEQPAEAPVEAPVEESVDVTGTYTFVEISDMGASLWTLTLNADGTYTVEQDNPFGDKTVGESTYTAEGNIVSCDGIDASAFHGLTEEDKFADRLMGEFVGSDNDIEWEVNPADGTAVPTGYTGVVGTMDDLGAAPMGGEGGMPEGLDFAVAGTYTFEEANDMGTSYWTLELHPDMTYKIEQDNPFGDKTVGEGTYTYEDNVVNCDGIEASAFHGAEEGDNFADRLMGEFVGEDNSTSWIIDKEAGTMEPNV